MFKGLFVSSVALCAVPTATAQVIDFETLPSGLPTADRMEISTQYSAPPFGVTFRTLDRTTGAPIGFPRLAKVGGDRTAFIGCGVGNDTVAANTGVCSTFLTDDAMIGASANLEVTYVQPVARASAVLVDVDEYFGTYEEWTITAFDAAGAIVDSAVVRSTLETPCGGVPGNGTATPFSISSPSATPEIKRLVFAFTGTAPINDVGLAFDNFSPSESGLGVATPGCLVVPNSSGLPALVTATGSPVVTDNQLRLTAQGLAANATGYFLASRTSGFVMNPAGSQGNLCLGGAISRFNRPGEVQSSGDCGLFDLTIDLSNLPSPTGGTSVVPGDTWTFQCWYRDLNPGATSNFSSAIDVAFQ